jgi:hypothetical protein
MELIPEPLVQSRPQASGMSQIKGVEVQEENRWETPPQKKEDRTCNIRKTGIVASLCH